MIAWLAGLLLTAGADFAAENEAWNGLSYLATTAREAKVSLETPTDFHWSQLGPGDVLLAMAPAAVVDPEDLEEFVADGGLAVVALDAGADDRLARVFGVQLDAATVTHDRYFRDHPAFPEIAPPEGDESPHFLWYNVGSIVLNHPGALAVGPEKRRRDSVTPLISFAEPDQHFAIEVRHGRGYVLFVSDASVFINDMQRHTYGDKQLAANVMRYYCEKEECSVTLVGPTTMVTGSYHAASRRGLSGLEYILERGIDELNAAAMAAGSWLGRRELLQAATLILLVIMLAATGALPWPRPVPRFAWQAGGGYRQTGVDYWVSALSSARGAADFGSAAAALQSLVAQRLAPHLPAQVRGRLTEPEARSEVMLAIERVAGKGLRAVALRTLTTFHKVRVARTSGVTPGPVMGHAEFEELWKDCETLLKALPPTRT